MNIQEVNFKGDFYLLKFLFPSISLNQNSEVVYWTLKIPCPYSNAKFVLTPSLVGWDLSNVFNLVDFLRTINYFNKDFLYDKILLLKDENIEKVYKYIAQLRVKNFKLDEEMNSNSLIDFWSKSFLERLENLEIFTEQFVISSLQLFNKLFSDNFYGYSKFYLEKIYNLKTRLNKDFIKKFSFSGEKEDLILFNYFVK